MRMVSLLYKWKLIWIIVNIVFVSRNNLKKRAHYLRFPSGLKWKEGTGIMCAFTLIWWVSSFISGMFFISIAEIIEQLYLLNSKKGKSEIEDEEDDLELLN